MILEFPIYINKEITLQLENYKKKHHVCRLYAQDFTETLQFALCHHSSCEAIQVYTLQKCLLFQLKFGSNTDKPSKQFKRH